ncbi:MAG: DUF3035 domain-containing protein [Alphaproteobacteria bacterium]|nr:DUF3035 domain-containing protein [Alphaproteobacteria bacterium]
MVSSRSFFLFGLAALTLMTGACSNTREDLGLGRNPPDEFAVVDHPPLSMPPDFALRPPRPGAPPLQTIDPSARAQDAVFGGAPPAQAADLSPGEKDLLAAAGADKANPDIGAIINRESSQKTAASPHLVERLTDWTSDDEKPATVVDAAAEAARIKKAQADHQPVDSGATPVIEKQQSGWLGL